VMRYKKILHFNKQQLSKCPQIL